MAYAPGNGCIENKNIQERMVQHTMRKNRLLTVMMTAALAATAFAGCGSNEVATGAKPAVTESKTSETTESKTSETKETEAAETEKTSDPDDYTYCNLLSDPNFDMDNAIKDEYATEEIHRVLMDVDDKEVLYNIVDGDRYMEITGATVTEVNKTFTGDEIRTISVGSDSYYTKFYEHLAYYGIDPNPGAIGTVGKMFHLINTSMGDEGIGIENDATVTVLRAYTIPEDPEHGMPIEQAYRLDDSGSYNTMLCEVEVDGEPGYVILTNDILEEDSSEEDLSDME